MFDYFILRVLNRIDLLTFRSRVFQKVRLPRIINYYGKKLYIESINHYHAAIRKDVVRDYILEMSGHLKGTLIDVGAYIGTHSLIWKGKVYAFEPNPYNYRVLAKNFSLNSIEGRAYPYALGSRSGISMFDADYASMVGKISDKGTVSVGVRTLDSFSFKQISLVKIDVEGSEYDVLMGAAETLRKWRPLVIFEALTEKSYEKVSGFLESLGYSVESLDSQNFLATY